jgi:hypothetical protein
MLKRVTTRRKAPLSDPVLLVLIITSSFFSYWLMFHTFSFNREKQALEIASTCWSDFGSHIPLIRSFTYGANLTKVLRLSPPEYPHFPNEPIRYHFLFYLMVGIFEKIGLPIDYAFNLPSLLGFALLLVMIYTVAQNLFHSRLTGILSVILFIFNGSFSVFSFFSNHLSSANIFKDLLTVSRFPSFGPWDGGLVSAFLNLNIYTNQRHLGISFGLALFVIFLALKFKTGEKKTWIIPITISFITGLLLLLNQAAALLAVVFAGWIMVRAKNIMAIAVIVISGLPLLFLYLTLIESSSPLVFDPGYLVAKPLTLSGFLVYWLYNFGIHLFVIPLGIILAPKKTRVFLIPLLLVFIIPNLIRFSPDMINNHKFFNFFLIIGTMYSAWVIRRLIMTTRLLVRIPATVIALFLAVTLTASGVIDFLVIVNDIKGSLPDVAANPDARFILENTQPDTVVLNSTWFYHPASLAGRSVFSGYPYFTWSYGYDKDKREEIARAIYNASSAASACRLLIQNNIAYVETRDKGEYVEINKKLWNQDRLPAAYKSRVSGLMYFRTIEICGYEK